MFSWFNSKPRGFTQAVLRKDPNEVSISHLFPEELKIRAFAHGMVLCNDYEIINKLSETVYNLPENTKTFLEKNPFELWICNPYPTKLEDEMLNKNPNVLGYYKQCKIGDDDLLYTKVISIRYRENKRKFLYTFLHELGHHLDLSSNMKQVDYICESDILSEEGNTELQFLFQNYIAEFGSVLTAVEKIRNEIIADHITVRLSEHLGLEYEDIDRMRPVDELKEQIDRAIEDEGLL